MITAMWWGKLPISIFSFRLIQQKFQCNLGKGWHILGIERNLIQRKERISLILGAIDPVESIGKADSVIEIPIVVVGVHYLLILA